MARHYGPGRTFRKGKGGIPARVEDLELIRDSIFTSLNTQRGERVMRPLFGSRSLQLLFETQGSVLNSLAKREVTQVLSVDPRIRVLNVVAHKEDTVLLVDIYYKALGVEDHITVSVR